MVRRAAGERGAALLLALFALLLVEAALLLFAGILAAERRAELDAARRLRLDALADSAADAALARLAAGDPSGEPARPFGGGQIAARVVPLGEGLYRIEARAALAGLERRLELTAQRTPWEVRVLTWRSLGVGPAG